MNDPKRWLEDGGDATSEERELLEAGRMAAMPGGLRREVWLGVSAATAGLGVSSEAAGASLGTSGDAAQALGGAASGKGVLAAWTGSAAAKGVIALAIVGGAGFGVIKLRSSAVSPAAEVVTRVPDVGSPPLPAASPANERAAPRTDPTQQSGAYPPSLAGPLDSPSHTDPMPTAGQGTKGVAIAARRPVARLGTAAATPSDDTAPPQETAPPRESPVETRANSRLREESAAVLAIRKTLLGGDPIEALRMIERAGSEFPGGVLAEEREALAVRALAKAGQDESARLRGRAFLRAFPKSPHASEVRAVAGL